MTNEEAIKICTREKECVQSALDVCADGGHYVSPDGIITAVDYVEALGMAISALREQEGKDTNVPTKWISVEERLPEDDLVVLVFVSGKPKSNITLVDCIELATYSSTDGGGWILEMWPMWEHPDIKYWMPLPEAPKEEV